MIYRYYCAVIVIWLKVIYALNTPPNPCPDIFKYRYDGSEWFGTIELRAHQLGRTLKLNVNLSLRQQLPTTYPGALELYASREETLHNIINNKPVLYRIKFPLPSSLPRVTQILINNQVICSGPSDYGPLVTSIKLEHALYTELAAQQFENTSPTSMYQIYEQPNTFETVQYGNYGVGLNLSNRQKLHFLNDKNKQQTSQNTFHQLYPDRKLPQISYNKQFNQEDDLYPQEINSLKSINNICGKTEERFNINPLIVGGQQIKRGSWPWLAAVYLNLLSSLSFRCGGNLISSQTVVTSAHCLAMHNKKHTADDVLIFLGRYNINDWNEAGSLASSVNSIHIHPDYKDNLETFDADIAIVLLKNKVRFTEYIRPVCLWFGPSNIQNIEGEQGIVVGWGRSEAGQLVTSEPRKIEVTIVSESVCLRSNGQFLELTSNRTFCAGNQDGRGPCTGDSGGGLILRWNNIWTLRGIVSASLSDPIKNSCDLGEFVIYVDIAKFLDWIYSLMIF